MLEHNLRNLQTSDALFEQTALIYAAFYSNRWSMIS